MRGKAKALREKAARVTEPWSSCRLFARSQGRTRLLVPVNRRHVRHCHKLFDRRGL